VLTFASWLFLAMGATWYGAAVGWPFCFWLRWVVVGPSLLVGVVTRALEGRATRPPPLLLPLGLLVTYGLGVSLVSRSGALAFWKCATFAVTVSAAVVGGSNLVERFGRDRVFAAWRWIWRLLLAWSVVCVGTGLWPLASEGVRGPTGNPNMYASILVSVGLVLLGPPARREGGTAFLVEAVVGVLLLLLTRARASIAGLGAAVMVAVLFGTSVRRWVIACSIAAVAAVALLAVPDRTVYGVEDVLETTGGRSVFATRETNWAVSWDAMLDGLPFGFGWGVKNTAPKAWEFDLGTAGYGREEGTSWLPIGEELGLPGFLLWAWIWWVLVRSGLSGPRSLRSFTVGAFAYYFVLATFEAWLLSPGNWESWAFWTTVGFSLTTARGEPAASARSPSPRPLAGAAV
jgi:hypothetical protein